MTYPHPMRLALAALLMIALTACGGSDEAEPPATSASSPETLTSAPQVEIEEACAAVRDLPGDLAPASRWAGAFDDLTVLADDANLEATGVLLPAMEAALAYSADPPAGSEALEAFELLTEAKKQINERC